jgi:hypothetical protein
LSVVTKWENTLSSRHKRGHIAKPQQSRRCPRKPAVELQHSGLTLGRRLFRPLLLDGLW